jgi:hypothetical protein
MTALLSYGMQKRVKKFEDSQFTSVNSMPALFHQTGSVYLLRALIVPLGSGMQNLVKKFEDSRVMQAGYRHAPFQ